MSRRSSYNSTLATTQEPICQPTTTINASRTSPTMSLGFFMCRHSSEREINRLRYYDGGLMPGSKLAEGSRFLYPRVAHPKWRSSPRTRASDGCRFLDQRTAIPPSFEAFEPILQTLRNVRERIRTMSESRRVRRYHDCDKAAGRRTASTLFLRRCDGIFARKCFGVLLGLNSTKPPFSE